LLRGEKNLLFRRLEEGGRASFFLRGRKRNQDSVAKKIVALSLARGGERGRSSREEALKRQTKFVVLGLKVEGEGPGSARRREKRSRITRFLKRRRRESSASLRPGKKGRRAKMRITLGGPVLPSRKEKNRQWRAERKGVDAVAFVRP